MSRSTIMVFAILVAFASIAQAADQVLDQVGDVYQIVIKSKSSRTSNDQSSGSSNDSNALIERVIKVGNDGLELEYDFPISATAQDRAREWKLPARVLKPKLGSLQLLNAAELEARVTKWLELGKLPRSACGHWIFTWTAIQIQCDPQSVMDLLESIDLRPADLKPGSMYKDPMAIAPAPLLQTATSADGSKLNVEMNIDPDHVRHDRVQADVAVAEMTGKKLTPEDAILLRSNDKISGHISVSFELDKNDQLMRRTRTTKIEILEPNGKSSVRTDESIVERHRVGN